MQHDRGLWQLAVPVHEPGVPCQIVVAAEPQITGADEAYKWLRGRHGGLVTPRVAPQIDGPFKVALTNAARSARCRRARPRLGSAGRPARQGTVCRDTSRRDRSSA